MKLFEKIYNEDYFLVGCDVLYIGRHNKYVSNFRRNLPFEVIVKEKSTEEY
jgi:hypothetical protein